ncbi:MAG: hypothetical protein KVP17_004582 [Porospora cf. gigantea B]|uniref:uncharacterized protein n=1 Tax=Porospora cf. gigantea B TaxID=2853592 RepID=UPI003571A846|nr:MAG: hypothetical protein KVP17_004582 [Porospora cf. gigantea B]
MRSHFWRKPRQDQSECAERFVQTEDYFVPTLGKRHLIEIDPRIMIRNGEVVRSLDDSGLHLILETAQEKHCKPSDLFRNIEPFKPLHYDLDTEAHILAEVTEQVRVLKVNSWGKSGSFSSYNSAMEPIDE